MKTVIIDNEPDYFHSVEKELLFSCPNLSIGGYATSRKDAVQLVMDVKPSIVIMEVNMPMAPAFDFLTSTQLPDFETIFVSHCPKQAIHAIKYQPSGYLLKPNKLEELLPAIDIAEQRILRKVSRAEGNSKPPLNQDSSFPEDIIGIPTMDGFEFIPIKDIIRCEGFQRCTRIVTKDRSDIISSYHIGVFAKRLGANCFYSTHKSHLINLHHIRTYHKEGTIKMTDGAAVPVSKRRKGEFVKLLSSCR